MLNVKWFFGKLFFMLFIFLFTTWILKRLVKGIPFNDSVTWRLDIAESAQNILGDNLLGLQAGNEPDFYEKYVPFSIDVNQRL